MKVCDDNASEDAGQNIHGRDAKKELGPLVKVVGGMF